VILSGLEEDNLVRGLVQAVAIAYLVKGAPGAGILDAVRRAVEAETSCPTAERRPGARS